MVTVLTATSSASLGFGLYAAALGAMAEKDEWPERSEKVGVAAPSLTLPAGVIPDALRGTPERRLLAVRAVR